MDGLIKGLINVAIGNDDDDDHNNYDERSRSSWAQVVSGQQDDDHDHDHDQRVQHNYQNQTHNSRWNNTTTHVANENYQQHEDHHERPNYNRNEENQHEKNTDGWQTAHKKHHKRPQRIKMEHWGSYKTPPHEQQYSQEVQSPHIDPSHEELSDYRKACSKLWEIDFNRLTPEKDYKIDVGEGKRVHQMGDMAESSLFTWVSEEVLRKPTYSRFCALLDNYNPNEGCRENVTEEDRREQIAFIEEISRTAPIKYLYKYLLNKGVFSESYEEFKGMLKDLWFTLYGRGGASGSSSSFEHVFVGELKQRGERQVSGFHNWLQSSSSYSFILKKRREALTIKVISYLEGIITFLIQRHSY